MRVAVLNLHVGGMMHYASSVANSVADRNDVACYCPVETPAEFFNPRVRVFRYPVPQWPSLHELPRLLTIGPTLRQLKRELREWRPDVLHVTSGHVAYILFLPALASKVPIVSTMHDVAPHPGETRRRVHMKLALLVKHSRLVLVHTEALREQAMKEWDLRPEHVRVVPFCEFNVFRTWARGRAENQHQVLLFGRLRAYKGIEVMLEAMPLIRRQVPEANLVIAGQGDLRPYRRLIRQAGDTVVVRNRFLDNAEAAELFETSAVIVAPHLEASQSAIPFVAASFARPVVASRVGGIPEVVRHGETGLLVPPGDREALAEAVVKLLKDPARRRQMGARARGLAAAEHGDTVIAEALGCAYRSVVRG